MTEEKTDEEIFEESWGEATGDNPVQPEDSPDQNMCPTCGNDYDTDSEGNQYCSNCEDSGDTDDNAAAEEEEVESESESEEETTQGSSEDVEAWKKAAEQWEQKYKSFEGRYRKEKESLQNQIDELKAENEKLQTQMNQSSEKSSTEKSQSESTDADTDIQEFADEFPDLAGHVTKLVEKKAQELVDQRVGKVEEEMTPVKQKVESQAQDEHFRRITESHPDWKSLVSEGHLQQWINDKPSYAQNSANQVMESGSTEEVIELLDDYKRENQTAQSSTKDTATKKKAQEASAVKRHSRKPKSPKADPNDFDSAWDEANGRA